MSKTVGTPEEIKAAVEHYNQLKAEWKAIENQCISLEKELDAVYEQQNKLEEDYFAAENKMWDADTTIKLLKSQPPAQDPRENIPTKDRINGTFWETIEGNFVAKYGGVVKYFRYKEYGNDYLLAAKAYAADGSLAAKTKEPGIPKEIKSIKSTLEKFGYTLVKTT